MARRIAEAKKEIEKKERALVASKAKRDTARRKEDALLTKLEKAQSLLQYAKQRVSETQDRSEARVEEDRKLLETQIAACERDVHIEKRALRDLENNAGSDERIRIATKRLRTAKAKLEILKLKLQSVNDRKIYTQDGDVKTKEAEITASEKALQTAQNETMAAEQAVNTLDAELQSVRTYLSDNEKTKMVLELEDSILNLKKQGITDGVLRKAWQDCTAEQPGDMDLSQQMVATADLDTGTVYRRADLAAPDGAVYKRSRESDLMGGEGAM
eukprot:2335868-Rhodomonas_salina.1